MKNNFTDSITTLHLDEAVKKISTRNLQYRIIEEDGNKVVGTRDYNLSRVNLSVLNKVVVNAYLG